MDVTDGTLLWSWTDGLGVAPAPEPAPTAEGGAGWARSMVRLYLGRRRLPRYADYGTLPAWWRAWLRYLRTGEHRDLERTEDLLLASVDETDLEELSEYWDE